MEVSIIQKMEEAKVKVEDDDISPLVQILDQDYALIFDDKLINFSQDDILKQIFG
jgi:hypothetical protein